MKRLTTEERRYYASDNAAAYRKLQTAIKSGTVQCDRCDTPAQTFGLGGEEADAICYGCFVAYKNDKATAARAASPLSALMAGV